MKTLCTITIALIAAALLSGCCACRSYQKRTRRPLEGTAWQLVQLDGRTVAADKEPESFTIRFMAAEGRFAGKGACNRLFGPYVAGEKRSLKIGPIASTMMACPGVETERAFAAALEATTHYDMDGPMLMLLSDGELKAVLQARP